MSSSGSSDADAAAAAADARGQVPATEEFTLLDMEGLRPSSSASGSSGDAGDNLPPSAQMARFAWSGLNVLISCSALAVARQMLNPAHFNATAQEAAANEASRQLPAWFAGQYKQRRAATAVTHLIAKDTGILMATSGLWYGLQFGLKKLRGQDDALNVCVAGTVSSAFLGAAFFEPFKLSRVGIWSVIGGAAGYYGYREQQSLRAALLEKQQELEQKHLHVEADQVHQKLDGKLLRQLLEMEQQERLAQLRNNMQQQGVAVPAPGAASARGGSAGDGGGGDGSSQGAWGVSSGGLSGGADGADSGDSEWQRLLSSAPWLQPEQQEEGAAKQRSQQGGRGSSS